MGTLISMIDALRGHRVYVDTNIFIYFLEKNVEFFPAAAPVIQAILAKEFLGFTGARFPDNSFPRYSDLGPRTVARDS